jgi:putative transcriptional regulator
MTARQPQHHPHPETLMSHVAGTLPNAISCVVACHASLCKQCADQIRWLGMLGGVVLKNFDADAGDHAFMDDAVAHWSVDMLPPRKLLHDPAPKIDDPLLPRPLARHLGISGEDVPWRKVVKGVRQHWVKLPKGAGHIRLLRLAPGKELLEHTHTGMELTMVLKGIYGDHTGEYQRGDVIEWDEGSVHQPHASLAEEECVCLIGSEGIPHYSRLVARLLRPIMGF